MNLIRFGNPGTEKPGLWRDGRIVDLTAIFPDIPDIGETFFREGWLERVEKVDAPGVIRDIRIGCPVSRPGKIICLGKNYAEHARETGLEIPARPLLFCKTGNALNGPFDPIRLPKSSMQIDWEVELAVVIGKEGKRIAKENAFSYIAGFMVFNDVSGRDAQFSDGQWFRGKSFDTFAPAGPALVTPDEIGPPDSVRCLQLTTRVNGITMQDGNTRDMIFNIPDIIADISEDITLSPGDIIATGTPSGVGFFRNPPLVLKAGDLVTCTIEKIGTIENRVL
jgi:2-keto-4-pentenoate hydratase/2-oxohepta-3-ene-1,7-dioic acid hydratase in catechol pathway